MTNEMPNYEKLKIWQESMALTKQIYLLSQKFPKTEQFGLTNQLRRSAMSVPLNIAEGQGRASQADFKRFLLIALGSLNETLTALTLAKELTYVTPEDLSKLRSKTLQIMRQTQALITSLRGGT